MKILIALGFKLGFVPIFHFPLPHCRFPTPVHRFSYIQKKSKQEDKQQNLLWAYTTF